jgi:hypothetical protein
MSYFCSASGVLLSSSTGGAIPPAMAADGVLSRTQALIDPGDAARSTQMAQTVGANRADYRKITMPLACH